jgi:ketosteroid isomerase-like protein
LSRENVERHRRAIEAFNAHDLKRFISFFDREAEFHSVFAAVGGAIYRGHDELPRYFRDLTDAWGDEIRIEPEAYFDLGEDTLLFLLFHGRGRQSGVEVAMRVALRATWRNGLVVHLRSYTQREEALRDLGVSEEQLEPIAP